MASAQLGQNLFLQENAKSSVCLHSLLVHSSRAHTCARIGDFLSSDGKLLASFELELARSEDQKRQGLMYRNSMPDNHGMMLFYDAPQPLGFWMKNTYIPLDMIFLDKNFKVVGVLRDVPILNSESRKIDVDSQFVVELNAGITKKNQITEGCSLSLK